MFRFNVRVYGILINENKQVLVSDELIRGKQYTKFPGGGLEHGEGTRDCLMREFMEEMNLKVEVLDHIYTTDFYQQSAFYPEHQVISIFYMVRALEPITVRLNEFPFQFDEIQMEVFERSGETESFRFIDWDDLNEECVSLPIEKIVIRMLKGERRLL